MRDRINDHAIYVKSTVRSVLGQTLTDPISRSWRRCMEEYGLDPEREPEIVVVNGADLRERQERLTHVLAISKAELRNLYEQIAGSGFAVMIADADGVILDYVVDRELTASFQKQGLCTGGLWGERQQGTNAMGTCVFEKEPLGVHQKDHFLPRNVSLTSSAAPIHDHQGGIVAVLNAACHAEVAQRHTLALVNTSARTIENRLFQHCFRDATIVRFHNRAELIGSVREGEIALSADGSILGANRNALSELGYRCHRDIVGKRIEEVFQATQEDLLARSADRLGALIPIDQAGRSKRYFVTISVPEPATGSPESSGRGRAKRREIGIPPDPVTREILLDELGVGDPRMAMNVRYVKSVRDRDIPILIHGETGTGKEVMARAIHTSRDGDNRPFIAVNCAAIPENLIESELFGYAPGAFTGANREGQKGKIFQADKGTLFLDEIGDMPLQLQTRLLRVLEQREVHPLGSNRAVKVDIALISATHRNLTELVAAGRFRSDLYYRLQGLMLSLPPLRERLDKRALIKHMVELESQRYVVLGGGNTAPIGIDDDALRLLENYHWPGNIRQLRTVIRVSLAICSGSAITVDILPDEIRSSGANGSSVRHAAGFAAEDALAAAKDDVETPDHLNTVQEAERNALMRELEKNHWNIASVARNLNVSRLTVYRKMNRLGIRK